ncbi:cellulose binding domain-containing protein [Actinoplanes sp. NPDC051633]|uniref:cellulose binding domain-containing protein n=1 Tax=Actinoplanes sp. NPDC051633 TaxID=3155670 RepID=UPI0034419DAD
MRPLRRLRLKAGLRLLPVLRMGAAKPLGGGLFQGGRVLTLPSPRVFSLTARHRMQAGVATVAMLAAVGVSWAVEREPAEVGPAQASAAGVGTPAGVAHTAGCTVRYRVEKDTGADFEARVTVVNNGEQSVEDWRMEFAYPGTQRLTDPARAIAQNGRKVVYRGKQDLGPGRSASVTLRGAYRGSNPLPLAFTLDGRRCEAQVVGARTPVIEPDPSPTTAATVAARKKSPSSEKQPAKKKVVKPAPKIAPKGKQKARPTPPPAPERRVGGFSVAI